MDEQIYLVFIVLKLSELLMCETYYVKLQPNFGEKFLPVHSMDADAFVLSLNTNDIVKDLQNLKGMFDWVI